MPAKLFKQFQDTLKAKPTQFPTAELQAAVDQMCSQLDKPAEKVAFSQAIAPISELLERYRNGIDGHEKNVIASLFRTYLNVEKLFSVEGKRNELVIEECKEQYKDNLDEVYNIALSHSKVPSIPSFLPSFLPFYDLPTFPINKIASNKKRVDSPAP
jgi:acetyl-CoA carboxylase/biotin carboxylase 1